jgi:hypothetical protein
LATSFVASSTADRRDCEASRRVYLWFIDHREACAVMAGGACVSESFPSATFVRDEQFHGKCEMKVQLGSGEGCEFETHFMDGKRRMLLEASRPSIKKSKRVSHGTCACLGSLAGLSQSSSL